VETGADGLLVAAAMQGAPPSGIAGLVAVNIDNRIGGGAAAGLMARWRRE
jgi:NCAIR mutase (PurE)-related protein